MAKYVFYVSTGYAGAEIKEEVEVPDENLEGLTEEEIEKKVEEEYREWLENNAELSWWPAEEN